MSADRIGLIYLKGPRGDAINAVIAGPDLKPRSAPALVGEAFALRVPGGR
jgi:hypothetical protein